MKECADCNWCKALFDSKGRCVYFCMNTESVAYLEETGLCGWCGLQDDDEDEENE